ncbi:transposase family protein [Pseudonocardia sp. RS010]|uniref:transposase family protein n=1 Tax=Pseudonocardia sp. RS010 TaxID=3385979 RepID=UPI0039A2D404
MPRHPRWPEPRLRRTQAASQLTFNALHRATRALGERGFALLTSTWRCPQRITISPSRIGTLVRACLVLTLIDRQLHRTSLRPPQ